MSATIVARFFDDVEQLEAIADAARVLLEEMEEFGLPSGCGVWLLYVCFKPLRLALEALDKKEEDSDK